MRLICPHSDEERLRGRVLESRLNTAHRELEHLPTPPTADGHRRNPRLPEPAALRAVDAAAGLEPDPAITQHQLRQVVVWQHPSDEAKVQSMAPPASSVRHTFAVQARSHTAPRDSNDPTAFLSTDMYPPIVRQRIDLTS